MNNEYDKRWWAHAFFPHAALGVHTLVFRHRPAWIAGRPHTGGSVCCHRASRVDGENDGVGCEVDHDTAHQCKTGRFLFTMSLQCRMH